MVIECLAGRRQIALSFHDLTHLIRVNKGFSKLHSPSAAVIQQMLEPYIEQLVFLLEIFHYSKRGLRTRIPSSFLAPEVVFSWSRVERLWRMLCLGKFALLHWVDEIHP